MNVKSTARRIFSQDFVDKLDRDKIFDLAASLSYYTALSLAPLLVIGVMLVSLLDPSLKAELGQQVRQMVGGQTAETIIDIADNIEKTPGRGWTGLVGVFTLLFSASLIFGQLHRSLFTIFEVPDEEIYGTDPSLLTTSLVFIERKAVSMGMVLAFVTMSMAALLVSSGISFLFTGTAVLIGQLANLTISLLIFSLLFMALYYFMLKKRIRFKVALAAGVMTAFLFSFGNSMIGLYIGQRSIVSLYGAAGSLLVLLMWVYYSSLIIFVSAEVANEFNKNP